jgi:hypothetical protein
MALWVAALINGAHQPRALGIATDVRPAALKADSAEARVRLVRAALDESIQRLGAC